MKRTPDRGGVVHSQMDDPAPRLRLPAEIRMGRQWMLFADAAGSDPEDAS